MLRKTAFLAAAFACCTSSFALAQGLEGSSEAPPPATVAPKTGGIEDIVVTARRREERLQDVPIAISAVSASDLLKSGITDSKDLTQAIPSLVYSRISANFQPYIRGVGTRNGNAGDESAVSVYVDGIYQPIMSALGFDLLSIDRVEVLRGPQGTLFGRNATGGLINIITPDPDYDPAATITLNAGNFGQRSAHFYATTGIAKNVAADVAALYKAHSGYNENIITGDDEGELDSMAIRSKILFEPTESLKFVLTGGHSDTKDATAYSNQALNGNSIGLAGPTPPPAATGDWESSNDYLPGGQSISSNVDLKVLLDLTSALTLESTSSWQRNFARSETDSDGTFTPRSRAVSNIDSEYVMQELRLLSSSPGRFNWTAGANVFQGQAGFGPIEIFSNYTVPLAQAPVIKTFSEQDVFAWAVFGEANFDLTDRLQLTVGLRYTDEEREFDSLTFNSAGAVSGLVPLQKASFDELTYRASILYQITDNANVYASYSTGFKSGVFNGFARTLSAAKPVDPETLDAYEIGFKSDPSPILRLNGSAFYYNYKDQQQSAREPVTALVILLNAAESKMWGGELEAVLAPTDNLRLRVFASYLNAEYDSFPGAQIFTPAVPGPGNVSNSTYDASGNKMLRAPEYTLGASFSYTIPTEAGEFGVSGNVYHSAEYAWEFANRVNQDAYTLVNGEISWSPRDNVHLAIWGKNLTNEVVWLAAQVSATTDNIAFQPPLSYGGRVAIDF